MNKAFKVFWYHRYYRIVAGFVYVQHCFFQLVVCCNNSDQCISTAVTLLLSFKFESTFRGRRKLFCKCRGWVKMSSTMVGRRQKIKKKHWLKHPKAVLKNRNLDQNVNDSKSHIWNSQELRSQSTLKANFCIFLYISVRMYLFQRRSKILFEWGWIWGEAEQFS